MKLKENSETKLRILLVDDDPDFLFSTKIILENSGYKIITAANGKQGINKAKSEQPDLIVLDVMLPDYDGFSICRELKDNPETVQIPVIILTSVSKKRDASYADVIAYCHKADEFLEKPVDKDELLFSIRKLLKKKKTKFSNTGKKRSILIADMDSGFVSKLEKVLSADFEVFIAESGIEALKIARAFLPDLILLEITLPDKDGFSVCYEIKSNPKTHHIPVILVSEINKELTHADFAAKVAFEHKADDFIAKPIKPDQLAKVVKKKLSV